MGMASRSVYDNLLYLLYVEDEEYSINSFYLCSSGHPRYITTYQYLNLSVSGSSISFGLQLPKIYASMYNYRSRTLTGLSMVTLSLAPFRYLANHIMDLPCSLLWQLENYCTGELCSSVTSNPLSQIIQFSNN